MSLKIGSVTPSKLYLGSTEIQKAYLGSNLVWDKTASFLLDTYTGASAACSLRQLRTGVTNVVRVRRDSDNTEQDFTPTEITDGTLTTFVGSGDGFVTKWYDQSGNGNDAVQTTVWQQPQIVDSGVLVTDGGNPSLKFAVSNAKLELDQVITGTSDRSIFIANKPNSTSSSIGINCLLSLNINVTADGGAYRISRESSSLRLRVVGRSDFSYPSGQSATDYNILSNIWTSGGAQDAEFWSNGVVAPYSSRTTVDLDTGVGDGKHYIGWYDATGITQNQNIQELIIYASDESSNRSGIETNINNHYSIY